MLLSVLILSALFAIFMSTGLFMFITKKGAWMIAVFHSANSKSKKKPNKTALCRFIGLVLVLISCCLLATLIGVVLESQTVGMIGFFFIVSICLFALIFANLSKRFVSAEKDELFEDPKKRTITEKIDEDFEKKKSENPKKQPQDNGFILEIKQHNDNRLETKNSNSNEKVLLKTPSRIVAKTNSLKGKPSENKSKLVKEQSKKHKRN